MQCNVVLSGAAIGTTGTGMNESGLSLNVDQLLEILNQRGGRARSQCYDTYVLVLLLQIDTIPKFPIQLNFELIQLLLDSLNLLFHLPNLPFDSPLLTFYPFSCFFRRQRIERIAYSVRYPFVII